MVLMDGCLQRKTYLKLNIGTNTLILILREIIINQFDPHDRL